MDLCPCYADLFKYQDIREFKGLYISPWAKNI